MTMFIKAFYVVCSSLVVLLFLSALAMAQGPNCGPRDKIVADLAKKHSEYLIVAGDSMELWASNKGTWTILRSMPGGTSCIAAAGHNIQFAHPAGPNEAEL